MYSESAGVGCAPPIWNWGQEKKKVIWLKPITTILIPSQIKKNNNNWQHKTTTQHAHYTTIADLFRTVSWHNYSHSTGVVNPVYGIEPSHYLQKLYNQKTTKHL